MLNFKIHFYELKLKIYYFIHSLFSSFVISYFFAPNLINVLSNPFLKFVITNDSDFIFTNIFEVFTTYYTIALYFCCFFSVPLGVYFSFSFIKAGLFKYERDFFFFCLKSFICSIFFSCLFTYYIIVPCLLAFLLTLDLVTDTNFLFIKMETKIYEYITFLCKAFVFYCFFFFQIPILVFIFFYFKKPTSKYMIGKRRFWIFFCFIIACLFSSPDLFSLVVLSLPFLIFFEISIFFLILKNNYRYI